MYTSSALTMEIEVYDMKKAVFTLPSGGKTTKSQAKHNNCEFDLRLGYPIWNSFVSDIGKLLAQRCSASCPGCVPYRTVAHPL